jgi:hypothetical protein
VSNSRLAAAVWRGFRQQFGRLIGAAFLVFIPLALVGALVDPVAHLEENASAGHVAVALAAAFGAAATSLFGEVLYAGIVTILVIGSHDRQSLPGALRSLPYGRLMGADVLYALIVACGLLLFVVPGLVFVVWFALVAPIIEAEHRGVRDGLRRSRALVRPHFWRVALLLLPLVFASDLIAYLAFSGPVELLGHSLIGEWAGEVLAEVVVAPFLALFMVMLYLELREADPPRGLGLTRRPGA